MIDALTKYLVLVLFASFTTLFVCFLLPFLFLYGNEIWINVLYCTYFMIECVSNILSLYLQFPFNQKLYLKLFQSCHSCVKNYLKQKTINLTVQQSATIQTMPSTPTTPSTATIEVIS